MHKDSKTGMCVCVCVCVCVCMHACVCVAKPVAVELRCHATTLISSPEPKAQR